jgi:hypothetical protein
MLKTRRLLACKLPFQDYAVTHGNRQTQSLIALIGLYTIIGCINVNPVLVTGIFARL